MKKGFSVLEIIISISIIVTIAAYASTNLKKSRNKAAEQHAQTSLNQIYIAIQSLEQDSRVWPGHQLPFYDSLSSQNGITQVIEDISSPEAGLLNTDGTYIGWAGPYLDAKIQNDPYADTFFMRSDYMIDDEQYVVIGSRGPDRTTFTADDIILPLRLNQ